MTLTVGDLVTLKVVGDQFSRDLKRAARNMRRLSIAMRGPSKGKRRHIRRVKAEARRRGKS